MEKFYKFAFLVQDVNLVKNGSCIMCDYGQVRKENLSKEDIQNIMKEIITSLDEFPKVLLLNTLGSVLDFSEMPVENLKILLEEISKIDIPVIIFETHYLTINEEVLKLIKEKLPNKEIVIELGLESSNKDVRENCLNKYIDNEIFKRKINLIKSFEIGVEANVIFGTPFLNKEEQINDTINTINWCMENGFDKINFFPINIKPNTLLYKLYEDGKYSPIYHKDIIECLLKLPKNFLNHIYLCWYGNREIKYKDKKTILPICKENEYEILMKFYESFNLDRDIDFRIKALKNIREVLK